MRNREYEDKINNEKLIEVVSKYLNSNRKDYLIYRVSDAIYAIISNDEIYAEWIDDFLEEVGDMDYTPLVLNINEHEDKLKKATAIYDKTHEWDCNDTAKELYVDLICAISQDDKDVNLKINEFLKYIFDIDW